MVASFYNYVNNVCCCMAVKRAPGARRITRMFQFPVALICVVRSYCFLGVACVSYLFRAWSSVF